MREPDGARRLYRGLLSLYPREFRDRMGPSMEQTFADNVQEHRAPGWRLFAFLVWTFAETSLGVMKERARRARMSVVAAVAGLVLVLPLVTLEWATKTDHPGANFHVLWFVYLWLLAVLFMRTSIGTVRRALAMRAEHVAVLRTVSLVPRIAFLALIAWQWMSLVIDQMPCFLGATGC